MVTIQEVAKEAGVSVATVSRVLNHHTSVSAKTRAKVEDVIERLQYNPNMLGRNLRCAESRMLLVLVPSISNPFYSKIVQGIEDIARRNHYNTLLCTTDSDPDRENVYLDLLRNRMADGVISMDPAVDLASIRQLGDEYPVIQCCEYSETDQTPYVSIDNQTAAYKAVKHLLMMGHKRVSIINSDERFLYARLRQEGYLRALREFDIPVESRYIVHTDLHFESGHRAMKSLLALEERPTAVFAVSDTLAIGALRSIKEAELKVPHDIAVVGFDNIPFASMMNPSLTTVSQPMYEMGCEAARMLIKRIASPQERVDSIVMDYELIIRESTMG
ncbi:LacI family DNA-binding transcriptional regulator [Brevibacillus centrosporus]|jgi:DNA-binding LacI/PurR family transcriptional regulator|uniref:Transcriptional regulator, LacI family n=1 Tax=Brevibacillus centrosporus TaxID=54910 RepID=A0A1I3PAZ8_9BACL|nr:LacI family DNA-binding transcriptional regulator [Brevibacillus centrosporus]SFJ18764.1 transcriptional regulator, LacI family [Brevibacillus centrosporus]